LIDRLGQVVLSLKALSVSATVAASFDREKWRAQLEPIIDMWAKLTAAGTRWPKALLCRLYH
jgi:hypothetical protein